MVRTGPVIEFVPSWLGPVSFFVGIALVLVGVYARPREGYDVRIIGPFQNLNTWRLSQWGTVFFLLVCTWIAYLQARWLFVLSISVIGKYVEGVATVRTSIAITPENQRSKWFTRLLTASTIFWVVLVAISLGLIPLDLSRQFLITWTLFAFLSAIIGFSVKIAPAAEPLPLSAFLGFVLCVAGTEVFNLTSQIWTVNLVLGFLAFLFGYLTTGNIDDL